YSQSSVHAIHKVNIMSSRCDNIMLSTKVGKLNNTLHCAYQKETTPRPYHFCGPLYLDGDRLEELVGQGYDCAASHARATLTQKEGFDEYRLSHNSDGHYVTTVPFEGTIMLD